MLRFQLLTRERVVQVHVDEWRVEVQEGERAQDLLKQQQEAPQQGHMARCLVPAACLRYHNPTCACSFATEHAVVHTALQETLPFTSSVCINPSRIRDEILPFTCACMGLFGLTHTAHHITAAGSVSCLGHQLQAQAFWFQDCLPAACPAELRARRLLWSSSSISQCKQSQCRSRGNLEQCMCCAAGRCMS